MKNSAKKEGKVTHIMADGSVLDSLDDYEPDFSKLSPATIRLIIDIYNGKTLKKDVEKERI